MRVLVTGSCGLIGSEAVRYYGPRAERVVGIDNNMRKEFFGSEGDTRWVLHSLQEEHRNYEHNPLDIRDREGVLRLVERTKPDLVLHCAAQPSHDLAARIPFLDFDVNAVGTLNLLEATRRAAKDAVFVFMSTNKVYGDGPNRIKLTELPTRWEYDDFAYVNGIPESFPIDQCTHSLFGASKAAADILVQEYGRYFDMKTTVFRGGCLTGPRHSSVELHGFLSYFVKAAITGREYVIFGYKGKQVRDQIHSSDVLAAVEAVRQDPRCGAVYNMGGGKENSVSILECIAKVEKLLGRPMKYVYKDDHRVGDHICYYTDLRAFQRDYPKWRVVRSVDDTLEEIAGHQRHARPA